MSSAMACAGCMPHLLYGAYKTLYNLCRRWSRWSDNGGFQLIFLELAQSDGSEPEEILMRTSRRTARLPASTRG